MNASGQSQVNILVVDDNEAQLTALAAILEPLRQNIVKANSGQAALRAVLRQDFAVILLDIRMGAMSGLEIAELIKAREKTRLVPIIFLTGLDARDEALMSRAYSMGAVDYMLKPVQADILRSKVSVFVDLYRQQQRIVEQERLLRDSDRRRLELEHARELLQSEAKYREIMAAAIDAIIVFDGHGVVTMINHAASQMFGVAEGEALGQPISRFVPEGMDREIAHEQCVRPEEGAVGNGIEPSGWIEPPRSLKGQRTNGEAFPIEASVSCLNGTGERSYTLIARDVSERVRNEAELKRVNEELKERETALKEAITARSRFFASMSHELRTPINAVLGYTGLLMDEVYGPLNDRQRDGVKRTEKATRHLLELVNDVLDLSKIEAGKIDLDLDTVHVPDLISDLLATVQPIADERGSKLTFENIGEPVTIVSDPRRIRQILLNLLSNAVKFGEGKPIRITARARTPDKDTGVIIAVEDHGPGIERADQERIFREFEQGKHDSKQAGTGLGLSISRRLSELLHGALSLESTVGKGSTFTLTLPSAVPTRKSAGSGRPSRG